MLEILIGSFIASLGFGILFNIKGKKLLLAAIGGSLGGVVYQLCLDFGASELSAMFIASICFSLYSEILARTAHTPVTTFIICALIPLVPGGGMYRTMLATIQGDIMKALTMGLDTITIAGALVLGILLVSTIMKAITKRKKTEVKA